jgi:hypothetical protein
VNLVDPRTFFSKLQFFARANETLSGISKTQRPQHAEGTAVSGAFHRLSIADWMSIRIFKSKINALGGRSSRLKSPNQIGDPSRKSR